jgi:hypothetical protein
VYYIGIYPVGLEIEGRQIFVSEILHESLKPAKTNLAYVGDITLQFDSNELSQYEQITSDLYLAELVKIGSYHGVKESVFVPISKKLGLGFSAKVDVLPMGTYSLRIYYREKNEFGSLRSRDTGTTVSTDDLESGSIRLVKLDPLLRPDVPSE